jgi:phosphoserine phosphatase
MHGPRSPAEFVCFVCLIHYFLPVPFEVSLRDRLNLMHPSAASVAACVSAHPATFSPGFIDFIQYWREWYARRHGDKSFPLFLVSGGFRPLIEPLRIQLGLNELNVYANSMIFDEQSGAFIEFDSNQPTSRSGGKARALENIQKLHSYKCMIMIGDGATDLEACPPAKLMIGYGGIAVREKVEKQAHVFIRSWSELQSLLEQAEKQS